MSIRHRLRHGVAAVLLLLLMEATSAMAAANRPGLAKRPDPALLRFIREDMRRREPGYASMDRAERVADVAVATVRMARPPGNLSVVYYASHCGHGSCGELLFFERRNGSLSFRRILGTLQVELPVTLLSTFHHGHPDLGVNTAIRDPDPASVPAVVVFDGHRYSVNPTPAPGRPAGRLLIADLPGSFTDVTW